MRIKELVTHQRGLGGSVQVWEERDLPKGEAVPKGAIIVVEEPASPPKEKA